jgi:hypothetical protein
MSTLNVTNIAGPSNTGTAATLSSINGGPISGARNRIINGGMRIAQRGTSFAGINFASGGIYGLDRWLTSVGGAAVVTTSQSSDVPNNTFQYSHKIGLTTADTSIASSDFCLIKQLIEGHNVRDLIGQTFTLSFWVKSPKTGTHCVAFRNNIPDRSYIKEYTVVAANTWEYKTLTISGGLITAGTWDWTNGAGLDVSFTLATGSTYQATADSWQTGNFVGTSSQVNVLDNVANDFFLTGVQLEPGTVATPFERRSYGQELVLCQRYFETSFDGVAVGTAGNTASCLFHVNINVSDFYSYGPCQYQQQKRATPTVTIYSPLNGATGVLYNLSTNSNVGNAGVASVGTRGFRLFCSNSAMSPANSAHAIHYTASAEL